MTAFVYDTGAETVLTSFGTLLNSGFMKLYTGSQPAVDGSLTGTSLVTLTFSATAFGAPTASGGVATMTANAITSGVAGNTGAAGYFALMKSDNATIIATGTVATSGGDLNLSTTSISSGSTVAVSSFSVTLPET